MIWPHTNPDELAFINARLNNTQDSEGKPITINSEETDSARLVPSLERVATALMKSDKPLFSTKTNSFNKKKFIHATGLGRILLTYTTPVLHRIRTHLLGHVFTPHVATFIEHAIASNFDQEWNNLEQLPSTTVDAAVEKLNTFVDTVRSELQTVQHRIAVHNFKRASTENYVALMTYFDALFLKYSKLLIIRIDLSYRSRPERVTSRLMVDAFDPLTEEVRKHRDTFFKQVRHQFKGEAVGYTWKLEYGLFKGFHYHVILFLNSENHSRSELIATQLGEYWCNTTTHNLGLYFDFNKQSLRSNLALDLIDINNKGEWKKLDDIALYLTAGDRYLKLKLPDNCRTFGKGNIPKPANITLGRPRKPKTVRTSVVEKVIKSRAQDTRASLYIIKK